jgi:hypothetical protein
LAPCRIDLGHKREVNNQLFLADYRRGPQPILFKFLRAFRCQSAGQFDAKGGRPIMHVVTEFWSFHFVSLPMLFAGEEPQLVPLNRRTIC